MKKNSNKFKDDQQYLYDESKHESNELSKLKFHIPKANDFIQIKKRISIMSTR